MSADKTNMKLVDDNIRSVFVAMFLFKTDDGRESWRQHKVTKQSIVSDAASNSAKQQLVTPPAPRGHL